MAINIKDVAKRAGVSTQTVSNVLNSRVNVRPKTKQKVLQACRELDYSPNAMARGLITKRSKIIGLVLANTTNPIYGDILNSLSTVAEQYGMSMMVAITNRDAVSESQHVNLMLEQRVEGVILASSTLDSTATEVLQAGGIPAVQILHHPERITTDFYGPDNEHGISLATNHLISLGHTSIGFVRGLHSSITLQREKGYREAMKEAGLPVNERWILGGKYTREAAYRATEVMLNHPPYPTAIVCASDIMAIGVIDAAYDFGLNVPGELAVVGFDDMLICSIRSISMTTVRFDIPNIAKLAINRLLKKISGEVLASKPEYIKTPCKLIVRKTCGSHLKQD